MNNYFIILAAGKGKRFSSKIPKQFSLYKNKPLFMHSIDTALKSKLFKKIILVINKTNKFKKNLKVDVIKGGKERYLSSKKALDYIKDKKVNNVFIHDAARPNFWINLLKNLNKHIKNNKAVVPYINTYNSTKYNQGSKIVNLNRKKVLLTQTPQCFSYELILKALTATEVSVTDDAMLVQKLGVNIKTFKGSKNNIKVTTSDDIAMVKSIIKEKK